VFYRFKIGFILKFVVGFLFFPPPTSYFIQTGSIAYNGRAYETFCWSLAEAKCGEARRSNATELIGFVVFP
jgi:hypothetical protein